MFDKLYVPQARDELMPRIQSMKHQILEDSDKRFVVSVRIKDRDVQIILAEIYRKTVTVDILDPFGFIRIPRKNFKKMDDFKLFVMTEIPKIVEASLK